MLARRRRATILHLAIWLDRLKRSIHGRFGTLDLTGLRPWGALFALVLLLMAEGVARLFLPPMPPRGVYAASYRIQEKRTELDDLLDHGSPDVLFFGTSIVDCGVNPIRFDDALRHAGRRVTSYNLGFCGPGYAGIHAVLDRFFLHDLRPRLVYVCVSPNGLNRNRIRHVHEITRRFEETARLSRPAEWFGRLTQNSHLIAYRADLREWLLSGGSEPIQTRRFGRPRGFLPTRGEPDRPTDFAHRLGNFAPDARDLVGLESLCRWCRRVRATCVLVDMPLPARGRSNIHAHQHECYRRQLETVRRRVERIHQIEMTPEAFPDESFYDALHLNPRGAERLTALLAEDAAVRLAAASPD